MSEIHLYIVDDEPSVRGALSRLARSAKMTPHAFASVKDFLDAATPDAGACVVCDVRMPGQSGLELPGLLTRAGRSVPVIFVTAHDTEDARQSARQAGAAGFFTKPVDDQALLDAIAWAMGGTESENRTLVP